MERLTKRDWQIINHALALYQATPELPEDEGVDPEDIVDVRAKVWARLETA